MGTIRISQWKKACQAMSLVLRSFIVYCVVFLAVSPAHSQINDYCKTPKDKIGMCLLIKDCKELLDLLLHRPISQENINYLQKSNCGYMGLDPLVCCNIESNEEEESEIKDTVNRHQNGQGIPTTLNNQELLPTIENCTILQAYPLYSGEFANIYEFPWTALLEYDKPAGEEFHCGGVLINSRYVLTAAHCVKGKKLPISWSLDSVLLGEYNLDTSEDCMEDRVFEKIHCAKEPVKILIAEQIAHEEYDPDDINQYHDIALLRLIKEVKFNDFIKPICLPNMENLVGNRFVSGWGKSESYSESSKKLKMNVSIVDHDHCSSLYQDGGITVSGNQLCAGGNLDQDSCSVDSGGGLMTSINYNNNNTMTWIVEGIMSYGPDPCVFPGRPTVFTKVLNYIPWIYSKIKP